MEKRVDVSWMHGNAWRAQTRGHTVIADSIAEEGQVGHGMTPVEMMVASMGLCLGINMSVFAERHPEVDLAQVHTAITWNDAPEKPNRIGEIHAQVTLPEGLSEEIRSAMVRAAGACKVSHSLAHGIAVTIAVKDEI